MKKFKVLFLALVLAIATVCACFFTSCGPEKVESTAGLTYELSEDGSYYIMTDARDAASKDIIVGNYYNGKPIKAIGDMAFKFVEGLKSVVIAEGVVEYGECWLDNGTVERVVLPDGVEDYGLACFLICFELKEVVVGKDIKGWQVDCFEKVHEDLTIYFRGTEEQWNALDIPEQGNGLLDRCKIVYNYKD